MIFLIWEMIFHSSSGFFLCHSNFGIHVHMHILQYTTYIVTILRIPYLPHQIQQPILKLPIFITFVCLLICYYFSHQKQSAWLSK
jgi:hypothetical protein